MESKLLWEVMGKNVIHMHQCLDDKLTGHGAYMKAYIQLKGDIVFPSFLQGHLWE